MTELAGMLAARNPASHNADQCQPPTTGRFVFRLGYAATFSTALRPTASPTLRGQAGVLREWQAAGPRRSQETSRSANVSGLRVRVTAEAGEQRAHG